MPSAAGGHRILARAYLHAKFLPVMLIVLDPVHGKVFSVLLMPILSMLLPFFHHLGFEW